MNKNQIKVLLLFILLPGCLMAQSGFSLDRSFGEKGFVLNDVARFQDDQAVSILKSSTNKLIVTGHDPEDIVVSVLDTHGRATSSFGDNGTVLLDLGEKETVHSVIKSDSEHLLIGGLTRNANWSYKKNFVAKLSYTTGKLDSSFGNNGITLLPEGQTLDVMGLIHGPKDRFFVCGSNHKSIYCYAYKSNGLLDSSFGTYGRFQYSTRDSALLRFADVALQFDSMPVLLMNQGYQSALVIRITPGGTLDTKFKLLPGGVYDVQPTELLVTPQNLLLVCGVKRSVVNNQNQAHYAIGKLSSVGVLDSSFGKHGIATGLNRVHRENSCRKAKILSNGSVLLAGACDSITSSGSRKLNFQFALFTPQGFLDTTFGNDGFVRFNNFKYNGQHEEIQDFLILGAAVYATGYSTHDLGPSSRSHITCRLNMKGIRTASIYRTKSLPEIEVYPNPTRGLIQIRTNRRISVTIFDSKGQKVKDVNYMSTDQTIALTGPLGIYFVQVKDKREVVTRKVIKL